MSIATMGSSSSKRVPSGRLIWKILNSSIVIIIVCRDMIIKLGVGVECMHGEHFLQKLTNVNPRIPF